MPQDWIVAEGEEPAVHGTLHEPRKASGEAIVLTHGAGSNRNAELLVELAEAFADRGVLALRCDMPYRQMRPKGPPSPSGSVRDRAGLSRALDSLSGRAETLYLGGSSYGGRQATVLSSERPDVADALLLLSYPLHPPGKPDRLRIEHFPAIRKPCLFVHGSRDSFGTLDEMHLALQLIPGGCELLPIEGGTHGLAKKADSDAIAETFLNLARP